MLKSRPWSTPPSLQAARLFGHPVGSVCAVMDLKGVKAPSFAFFKVTADIGQANYPEMGKRAYILVRAQARIFVSI